MAVLRKRSQIPFPPAAWFRGSLEDKCLFPDRASIQIRDNSEPVTTVAKVVKSRPDAFSTITPTVPPLTALAQIGESLRRAWLQNAWIPLVMCLAISGLRAEGLSPTRSGFPISYAIPPGGRPSQAGWEAFVEQKATENTPGGLRLGAASLTLTAGIQVLYDSNINYSETNPLADIAVTPRLGLALKWPITRQNELHLQLGIQYRRYLFHPGYSQNTFVIDPGTALEYKVFTGDFVFRIYDAPEILTNPSNDPGIFNTVNFQQLRNTAGISVLHDLNKLTTLVGFERTDFHSLSGTYESNDGRTYTVYGNTFYSLTPTSRIGVRGVVSTRDYTQNILNDYVSTIGGVIFTSQITRFTSYRVEVGMQSASYASNGTPQNNLSFAQRDGFNEDVTGTLGGGNYFLPYFQFGVTSQLTRHIQHGLTFIREAQPSSISNYVERNSVTYDADWKLNRITTLNLGARYTGGAISSSTSPIDYWQWQARAGISLEIARDTAITFFYDYLANDMAAPNGSYTRQRFGMSLSCSF